jgi:hypothetical protein
MAPRKGAAGRAPAGEGACGRAPWGAPAGGRRLAPCIRPRESGNAHYVRTVPARPAEAQRERAHGQISSLVPATGVVLLALLWLMSAFDGWAAAAFCPGQSLGSSCRAHIAAAVRPSAIVALVAAALACAALLAPVARRSVSADQPAGPYATGPAQPTGQPGGPAYAVGPAQPADQPGGPAYAVGPAQPADQPGGRVYAVGPAQSAGRKPANSLANARRSARLWLLTASAAGWVVALAVLFIAGEAFGR